LLQNLNEEISSFESGANGNDFWLKVFAVSAVLLNLFAAAAAAAVNRETAQFVQAVKPWLLWGAAFASLCAGACTTIPAVTDMNKRRAAYTQELYALKVLKAEIQVETVSPQVATTRLKEILSMQPFKVQ